MGSSTWGSPGCNVAFSSCSGDRGAEIGDFSGNVGGGALAGGVIAGPAGAAVGASVGFLGWGISKGVRFAFDADRQHAQAAAALTEKQSCALGGAAAIEQ